MSHSIGQSRTSRCLVAVVILQTVTGCGWSIAGEGALIAGGGGPMPAAVMERFLELAGGAGASLVVIPTASRREPDRDQIERLWLSRGYGSVRVLHTRDRDVASRDDFVAPLDEANAVWISGGSQRRLAEVYANGPVEHALRAVIDRGGVVAGSSAGAAIQSHVMIASGNPIPVMAEGFDLAPRVIIDQHFLARSRINRSMTALAQHPDRIVVGIDESTAVVFRDETGEVLGESYAIVITPAKGDRPVSLQAYGHGERFALSAGDATSESDSLRVQGSSRGAENAN